MVDFLVVLITVECIALVLWGMAKPGRECQFPFLAGATFSGWVLPQLLVISYDGSYTARELEPVLIMTALCIAMCFIGYILPGKPRRYEFLAFNDHKLQMGALALTMFGGFFHLMLGSLPEEDLARSQWTGLPTIYFFFGKTITFGFGLALICFLRRPSRISGAIVLCGCVFYLQVIVLAARRGFTSEFVLSLLAARWFALKRSTPRLIVISGIVCGFFFVNLIGTYRSILFQSGLAKQSTFETPRLDQVLQIDVIAELKHVFRESAELRHCLHRINARLESGRYNLGLDYWNTMVFSYVPAQFLGANFKQSLMFELPDDIPNYVDYAVAIGATVTGMCDSFGAFWYVGCMMFLFIAASLRIIFELAEAGHIIAQVAYMLLITSALHGITHCTGSYIAPMPQLVAFLAPVFWFAYERPHYVPVPTMYSRQQPSRVP